VVRAHMAAGLAAGAYLAPVRARTNLCAGAVAGPLLLMRSGVGPARRLARAGVSCVNCYLRYF
jgi:choline dehydrogenase-like flavoprotein